MRHDAEPMNPLSAKLVRVQSEVRPRIECWGCGDNIYLVWLDIFRKDHIRIRDEAIFISCMQRANEYGALSTEHD